VRQYEALKQAAFGSELSYSTMDLIAQLTLLNYVDVPKIATITTFGKRILQVNKVYTDMISDTQIWINKKLMELLNARIRIYTQTAGALAEGKEEVSFPPGFAETLSGYFEAAGLPSELRGVLGSGSDASPAVLSINPEGLGFFGMTLTVGEKLDFVFFIDPLKVPAVFLRNGGNSGRSCSFKGRLSVITVPRDESAEARFNRIMDNLVKTGPYINLKISIKGDEVIIKNIRPLRRSFILFQSPGI
jgi:hypothetical protein